MPHETRDSIREQDLLEALWYLRECVPRDPLFTQLLTQGAGLDPDAEQFTMRIDGDDLAALCHHVHTIWTYFGFDPNQKVFWNQELTL